MREQDKKIFANACLYKLTENTKSDKSIPKLKWGELIVQQLSSLTS